MNGKQYSILITGTLVGVLTVLYPPFILTGGILPDFKYSWIWSPPNENTDGQAY